MDTVEIWKDKRWHIKLLWNFSHIQLFNYDFCKSFSQNNKKMFCFQMFGHSMGQIFHGIASNGSQSSSRKFLAVMVFVGATCVCSTDIIEKDLFLSQHDKNLGLSMKFISAVDNNSKQLNYLKLSLGSADKVNCLIDII